MNTTSPETIKSYLQFTFSHDNTKRMEAEKFLKQLESPNFTITLLSILDSSTDLETSQAAAIYIKNIVLKQWHLEETDSIIKNDERNKIKQVLVRLMLKCPKMVSPLLRATAQEICKTDFPQLWPSLMPELVQKLNFENFDIVYGALTLIDAVFERYLFKQRTPKTDEELSYCSQILVKPLTNFFNQCISGVINSSSSESFFKLFVPLLGALRGLISQELLAEVESLSDVWMQGFDNILNHNCGGDVGIKWSEMEISSKTSVLKLLSLFSEKYDDCVNYKKNQTRFVELTLTLISKSNNEKNFDELVIEGTNFVKLVVGKPWNKDLFQNENIIRLVLQKIVFPNIYIRDIDIEEFELNPMEYYRKDMENSINKTRRRTAFDLIQQMNSLYETQTTALIMEYVKILNSEYTKDPKQNWTKKDAALFLIVSICVKGKTERFGVVRLAQNFDVKSFLKGNVLPELTSNEGNAILKADCIKLLILFRSHIQNEDFNEVIQLMGMYLSNQNYVNCTYAARAIEKFYLLTNKKDNFILNLDHITELSFEILGKLFLVLEAQEMFGNEIVMRAITCVIKRAGMRFAKYMENIISGLMNVFVKMLKMQTNAQFNHYVFEAICAFMSIICKKDNSALASFEIKLFPLFEQMLTTEELNDFNAYVFQLLALMLRLRGELNSVYIKLLPLMLSPKMWIEMSNVKPLTVLLIEFLGKSKTDMKSHLVSLLGLFQKLLSQKANDYHSFSILIAIVRTFPLNDIKEYLPKVIKLICIKLEKDRSVRFIMRFCSFYCSLIALIGFENVFKATESVQKGMSGMLLEKVILPNSKNGSDDQSRRAIALGLTATLTSPEYIQLAGQNGLSSLLKTVIEIIELPSTFKGNSNEDLETLERAGSSSQYSELIFAEIKQIDQLERLGNVKTFLSKGLQELSKRFPDTIGKLIESRLDSNHKKVLMSYLRESSVSLQ